MALALRAAALCTAENSVDEALSSIGSVLSELGSEVSGLAMRHTREVAFLRAECSFLARELRELRESRQKGRPSKKRSVPGIPGGVGSVSLKGALEVPSASDPVATNGLHMPAAPKEKSAVAQDEAPLSTSPAPAAIKEGVSWCASDQQGEEKVSLTNSKNFRSPSALRRMSSGSPPSKAKVRSQSASFESASQSPAISSTASTQTDGQELGIGEHSSSTRESEGAKPGKQDCTEQLLSEWRSVELTGSVSETILPKVEDEESRISCRESTVSIFGQVDLQDQSWMQL